MELVVINGSSSTSKPVPQCSVLGPILFHISVNDMPVVVRCMVKLFADDTKLYYETRNQEDQPTLQNDINNIVDWTDYWLMKLNLRKCKHIEIGNVTNNTQFPLDKGLTSIQKVYTEKDLGVTFDNRLTFSDHVSKAVSKANQILGIMFRTFKYMDEVMFRTLFISLVRPHLEYAISVWSPMLKKNDYYN